MNIRPLFFQYSACLRHLRFFGAGLIWRWFEVQATAESDLSSEMMAAQEVPQLKRPAARPDEETRVGFEKTRAEAEAALVQVGQATGTEVKNTEPPSAPQREEGAERRVTFIVRLTVDERGQPRRIEVEHAKSGKKETFPGLDVQRLEAFMKACISVPNHPGTDDPLDTPPGGSRSPEARVPGSALLTRGSRRNGGAPADAGVDRLKPSELNIL